MNYWLGPCRNVRYEDLSWAPVVSVPFDIYWHRDCSQSMHWHILFILWEKGRGISAETCRLNDMFLLDDLICASETIYSFWIMDPWNHWPLFMACLRHATMVCALCYAIKLLRIQFISETRIFRSVFRALLQVPSTSVVPLINPSNFF